MSSNWGGSGTNETVGILRKPNHVQQNNENRTTDLLCFGYACKIFRDDEKAIYIDQGKHLIPWMGDENLKIDRYDVRATLSDLTQYEPPPGGYINRMDYLTPAEQRAEQLCEEERYFSLHHNEEEEQMYQEEELKRLHQQGSSSYGQVQFDYNIEQSTSKSSADESKSDESEELYTPPENLDLPESIERPKFMKQHAIIERTAKFISTQGAQMEILIKAKQSKNPRFEFLNADDCLNPYYKFILGAFKAGTYPVKSETGENPENNENLENTTEFSPNDYFQRKLLNSPVSVPTIKYKPSANCAYTQLISKIKGVPLPPEPDSADESIPEDTTPTLLTPQIFQANYTIVRTPEIVSTVDQENEVREKNKNETIKNQEGVEIKKISTGLALAQCYDSDSDDENDYSDADQTPTLNFPIPPENLQHIIDKTATYVKKNGKQFEDTLRTKQDDRFLFLNPSNEYHSYYMYKVTGIINPYPTSNGTVEDSNKLKVITPVSFSIKVKDDGPVSIKPALPQEASDDESESKDTKNQNSINPVTKATVPENVQRAIQLVESQLMSRGAQFPTTTTTSVVPSVTREPGQKSRFDVDNTGAIVSRSAVVASSTSVKLENQKELKRAEDKVKDRLAQIAREKLGLISKEKQLQLERKKKAMAFLSQIKNSGTSISVTVENENSNKKMSDDKSDSESVSSVHSIPISSPNENRTSNSPELIQKIKEKEVKVEKLRSSEKRERIIERIESSKRRRSRSPSSSKYSHKRRKKSKTHIKKKSKRRSRSRSKSRKAINCPDNNGMHSVNTSSRDRKRRKHSSPSKKSKKTKRN